MPTMFKYIDTELVSVQYVLHMQTINESTSVGGYALHDNSLYGLSYQ